MTAQSGPINQRKKMIPGPVDRLRLALDALRGKGLRGRYTAEGWATCRCGKEFFCFTREVTQEMADLSLRLKVGSMCRTCDARIAQNLDMCPEWLHVERGVSACILAWTHAGRCEPHPPIAPELLAQLRAKSKEVG